MNASSGRRSDEGGGRVGFRERFCFRMPSAARGLAVAGWGSIIHGKEVTVYSARMGMPEVKIYRTSPLEMDNNNKHR